MSELIRIDTIRENAEQAAREGKKEDACPYKEEPTRAELWLMYYKHEKNGSLCTQ